MPWPILVIDDQDVRVVINVADNCDIDTNDIDRFLPINIHNKLASFKGRGTPKSKSGKSLIRKWGTIEYLKIKL